MRIMDAGARLVLPILMAACLSLAGCNRGESEQTPEIVRPAKLIEVGSTRSVRTMTYPAVIEASTSAEITFQVSGLIQEFPVRSGQTVEEGDLIARLDQRYFENELATAEAEFEQAEFVFANMERLRTGGAASPQEIENARTARDVARARLETARNRLDDSTLYSPFAGLIAAVHGKQFENVEAQEPIVTLQTTGVSRAVFRVPATIVAQSEQFETEETVVLLDAAPDVRIPAVYQSAAAEADPQTQTYVVKFAFAPPDDLVVLPGMTGMVESRMRFSEAGGLADVPEVPTSAILSDGDVNYVWVVDTTTMTVSRQDVTVAPGVGESLAVLDGLEQGDVIVGAGASYLHEGMKIRPYQR